MCHACAAFLFPIFSINFVNFVSSLSRMEELTDPELIRQDAKCDRKVSLYGYVRGAHLQHNSRVHIIGNCHTTNLIWRHASSPIRREGLSSKGEYHYLLDKTLSGG